MHGSELRAHRSNAALPRRATGYMLLDAATKRVVAEQLSLEDAEKWVEEG